MAQLSKILNLNDQCINYFCQENNDWDMSDSVTLGGVIISLIALFLTSSSNRSSRLSAESSKASAETAERVAITEEFDKLYFEKFINCYSECENLFNQIHNIITSQSGITDAQKNLLDNLIAQIDDTLDPVISEIEDSNIKGAAKLITLQQKIENELQSLASVYRTQRSNWFSEVGDKFKKCKENLSQIRLVFMQIRRSYKPQIVSLT